MIYDLMQHVEGMLNRLPITLEILNLNGTAVIKEKQRRQLNMSNIKPYYTKVLEEIKDRESKATKGPWKFKRDTLRDYQGYEDESGHPILLTDDSGSVYTNNSNDEIFLNHVREDILWLIDLVDKLNRGESLMVQSLKLEIEILRDKVSDLETGVEYHSNRREM